ncbi:MAG: hypothetical protein Q4F57_07105 [Weeksellaceae bacterium]|nr:hypothetical protein [Weeksellaceae bacterium]
MNKLSFLPIALFAIISCNNPTNTNPAHTNTTTTTTAEQPIGGHADEHGCLGDAGQTWSALKQDCVQVFEVGQRLNPTQTAQGAATISAFVIFNDDKTQAEIFVPDENANPVLKQSEPGVYQDDKYRFVESEMALYINGEKRYSAEN